jgi:hypothetical protein
MGLSRIKGWDRSRWTAFGAVVAVCLGSGGVMTASATLESGVKSVFVPITPCRVMDTRGAPSTVGPRSTPLGAAETYSITVLGVNGNCTIPADAVGLSLNVTAVNPTAASFLTVFPFGAPLPVASNLNYTAGQAPVPNAVQVKIGTDKISFYNNTGSVDVAADIVGYYVDHNHNDLYYTKPQVDAALPEFAVVAASGTLVRSSGGITSLRSSQGRFEVDFNHDITQCAYQGTIATTTNSGTAGPAQIELAGLALTTDSLFVRILDSAGNLAGVDTSFHVVVVC